MTPADLVRAMRRISMLVRRGKVKLVDDSGPVQLLQGDFGPVGTDGKSLGIRDKIRMVYVYGFSSSPPADADIILLAVGGDFANAVGIGTNHQPTRPTGLSQGDSVQYDVRGQKVLLSAEGITLTDQWDNQVVMAEGQITVKHSTKVIVEAPAIQLGSGSGAKPVARVGDSVSGSEITSGSTVVTAA
ncbi:MAG TPA: phage baseplate assembly protein [Caulobacteraceae bacterium]|jgi:phage gp45-like|nr:phage baseplate assembly protein [Caulobacteraceae bacterium]